MPDVETEREQKLWSLQLEPTSTEKNSDSGKTSSRKRDHVDLCVGENVTFRGKTTGLERFELVHNALPEIDLAEVDTSVEFLGKRCRYPLIINSMTGGYEEAERINRGLAEACEETQIVLGLGSQRQALESDRFHRSWSIARKAGPSIPLFGNIGAPEIAGEPPVSDICRLIEMIEADGLAVHLNPLQELLQPEGNPTFSGVLQGIEVLVRELPVPIIVKEVGAGLSQDVIRRLIDVGVANIDVSGAGGTSWSGVEILRTPSGNVEDPLWDWGIPTAEAIIGGRSLCEEHDVTMIASGGIASSRDLPVALALGANMVASARPLLSILMNGGVSALIETILAWEQHLRYAMFLTGSANVASLRHTPLRHVQT